MTRPTTHVLNDPNINLLGTRQLEVYGSDTLADVEALCRRIGEKRGYEFTVMFYSRPDAIR